MNTDLRNADSRALHEPFAKSLSTNGPQATLAWLIGVLATQSSGLRSSNSVLVAYTGCPEAIDWLETTVNSPITTHWGEGAALLGTPWPRIRDWLTSGSARQLMALDTLIAYRAPAPNMAPFAQIAAPVLPNAPTPSEFEAALAGVIGAQRSPRIRKSVENIQAHASEILTREDRGVPVADLPRLFLQPELFPGSSDILQRHQAIISGMRQSIQDILENDPSKK